MAQWYYAEGPGRNVGPLSSQEIADCFRRGQLFLDSQVWREGMAQWQPLRSVAGELGLDALATPSTPPPLPGAAMPPPLGAPAYAAHPRTVLAPEPRRMSRGMIILIVCAALVVPVIAILGILAAIAVPAYNEYTVRAKLNEPIVAAGALKEPVQAYLAAEGRCPGNDDAGFQAPQGYASRHVARITIGEFDDGTCGMEVQVRGTGNAKIDDHLIWVSYETASRQWTCTSDIEDRLLPVQCRG